ncbi:MAG: hypothetical protein ACJA2C_000441 [Marinoscillum sp.]|jgi:hypothetical protein
MADMLPVIEKLGMVPPDEQLKLSGTIVQWYLPTPLALLAITVCEELIPTFSLPEMVTDPEMTGVPIHINLSTDEIKGASNVSAFNM